MMGQTSAAPDRKPPSGRGIGKRWFLPGHEVESTMLANGLAISVPTGYASRTNPRRYLESPHKLPARTMVST